jgi:hypothetical protein
MHRNTFAGFAPKRQMMKEKQPFLGKSGWKFIFLG